MALPHTKTQRNAFRLLTRYILQQKTLVVSATIWLALATALDMAGPMLAKYFIDDYLTPRHFVTRDLLILLCAYIGTQVLASALRYVQTLRFSQLALHAVSDIRQRVFRHVMHLPMAYHDRAITGQLVSRITNDTEALKDLYVQFLSAVVGNVVFLIGILIAMALLDFKLMLVALMLIPMVAVIIYYYQRLSGKAVSEVRQLRSDINAQLSESIQGARIIQAMGQSQRFAETFQTVNEAQYHARLRMTRIGALLLRPALDFIGLVILCGVLYVYGSEAIGNTVEVGVLYAFINYLSRYTEPLSEITQRFNLYQQAMVSGTRLAALLEEPLAGQEHASTQHSKPLLHGNMRFEHVSFSYDGKHTVLHDIDFHVGDGEFIGIVGHTGSGKSTLINLLLRFYHPQQGRVAIDGIDLRRLSTEHLQHFISLVPQEPFVLAGTLRDNIVLERNVSTEQIARAVHLAQLDELVARLPQGLDTLLGERGTRLSSGERQLLALARALLLSPRILLLDEATASIDSETEQKVQRALDALRGEVTVVAIAHRLSTIRSADNIIVLRHGHIIERGSHMALMENADGYYRRMVMLQSQREALAALD